MSEAVVHVDQDVIVKVVVGMCAEGSEVVDMSEVRLTAAHDQMAQPFVVSGDPLKARCHLQPCPTVGTYPCSVLAALDRGPCSSRMTPVDLNAL